MQTSRRIFSGMLSFARGVTSAGANIKQAIENSRIILKESFQRRGIKVDVEIDAGLPSIPGSQADLEQLFLNLATNARDAMPTGGVLSMRTEVEGDHIAILIRDTGCGIPTEFMSRIQEPFFTTKKNGNGLGLSICRSIVWNAGGQMDIKSQLGAGTQIRVLLPIVCGKPAGAAA